MISVLGGILAFFFAKDGERNNVSGIGWFMAALLVGGGGVSMYVIYEKGVAAETAEAEALKQANQAAIAANIQSSMILTLVGDFNPAQTIEYEFLYFEFEFNDNDEIDKSPDGFIGPFPKLAEGQHGYMFVDFGGFSRRDFQFTTLGGKVMISDGEAGSILSSDMSEDQGAQNIARQQTIWSAGLDPAYKLGVGGYVYSVALPIHLQLRRLIYQFAVEKSFGHVRFPKNQLTTAQLDMIERGFAKLAPTLVFFVEGGTSEDPCDVYYRVPFRLVRAPGTFTWDGDSGEYDAFKFELTRSGYIPETCEESLH